MDAGKREWGFPAYARGHLAMCWTCAALPIQLKGWEGGDISAGSDTSGGTIMHCAMTRMACALSASDEPTVLMGVRCSCLGQDTSPALVRGKLQSMSWQQIASDWRRNTCHPASPLSHDA